MKKPIFLTLAKINCRHKQSSLCLLQAITHPFS